MKREFESIIKALVTRSGPSPFTGMEIEEQLRPEQQSDSSILRNLNAAFLLSLCGAGHPLYKRARNYLYHMERHSIRHRAASFYIQGSERIFSEMSGALEKHPEFGRSFGELARWIRELNNREPDKHEAAEKLWSVFFPEGSRLAKEGARGIAPLREKRGIRITRFNDVPIKNPADEILFTSNVLITPPLHKDNSALSFLSKSLMRRIHEIMDQPQSIWYDHPVIMGERPEITEPVYGLRGLNDAVAFEKRRGIIGKDQKVTCLLSLSVTHDGLQDISRQWLKETMDAAAEKFENLRIYAFSENETERLVREILDPAAEHYGLKTDGDIREVIGVDGEYGRHYSFLKAMAAFWQVFMDTRTKATFKIDLDQVFPQEKLVDETGLSAFEHLKTPLWGALGIENGGRSVNLGMIAGALVNHADIPGSLFTPDVEMPDISKIQGDEWVFCSRLPQAVSTRAEMMARYGGRRLDGVRTCLQRVHVTGGTCGILVKDLRESRPFTPGFVGRAEDQAYMMSVMGEEGSKTALRYLHKDGLIMRHDKETFAGNAVEAASAGKTVGDYIRILVFSVYAELIPCSIEHVKELLDPFTGCFISRIPVTLVYLRLALKAASLFDENREPEGSRLLETGCERLSSAITHMEDFPEVWSHRYWREKHVWSVFYDILDRAQEGLEKQDPFAVKIKKRAEALVRSSEIVP